MYNFIHCKKSCFLCSSFPPYFLISLHSPSMSEGLRILNQTGILSIFIFLVNMASLVQPVEVRL